MRGRGPGDQDLTGLRPGQQAESDNVGYRAVHENAEYRHEERPLPSTVRGPVAPSLEDPVDLERAPDRHPLAAQWLPIDIALTSDHRLAQLDVAGELDGSTADELLGAIAHVLSGPATGVVELNLAGLDFVDSAGIRCLLNCRAAVEVAGSRLILVEPSPQVVRVLDLTGLLDFFGLSRSQPTVGASGAMG
jgi:anti-sigma B factor antagonist